MTVEASIEETKTLIAMLEKAVEKDPTSNGLKINLSSLRKMLSRLESEKAETQMTTSSVAIDLQEARDRILAHNARIAELRKELDEARDLVSKLEWRWRQEQGIWLETRDANQRIVREARLLVKKLRSQGPASQNCADELEILIGDKT